MTQPLGGQFVTVSPASQNTWLDIFQRDPSATAFQSADWMSAALLSARMPSRLRYGKRAVPSTWRKVARRTHILDLQKGYEAWWADCLSQRKRGKIRKTIRDGVVVEHGNSPEFVRRYYDLYLRWTANRAARRRLPLAVANWLAARREPLWKFNATAQKLGNDLSIYIASYQGQDAAGAVFLGAGRGAVYWRGASDTRIALPCNDLLHSEMIRQACLSGCTRYHMGESGGVASLEAFKESLGAVAYDYAEYVYERLKWPRSGARSWR